MKRLYIIIIITLLLSINWIMAKPQVPVGVNPIAPRYMEPEPQKKPQVVVNTYIPEKQDYVVINGKLYNNKLCVLFKDYEGHVESISKQYILIKTIFNQYYFIVINSDTKIPVGANCRYSIKGMVVGTDSATTIQFGHDTGEKHLLPVIDGGRVATDEERIKLWPKKGVK